MLCRNCGHSELDHRDQWHCPDGHGMYAGVPHFEKIQENLVYQSLKNPKFSRALERMEAVHNRKSDDYAHAGNRYSNFEQAAATAGVSVDQVFAVLIGVKLARLQELLKEGKVPNNESVQDTRLDLAVYAALWLSYFEVPDTPVR